MNATQRTITGIAAVGIPLIDQDRALRFYTETLGMEKRLAVPLPQFGALDHCCLAWLDRDARPDPRPHGVPAGVETGIRLTSPDAAAAHQHLRERSVDVGELLHWEGVPPMFALCDADRNGLEITQDESRS